MSASVMDITNPTTSPRSKCIRSCLLFVLFSWYLATHVAFAAIVRKPFAHCSHRLYFAGYSRIPVYEGNRQNIVTMLYIKDLALVDPDDNTLLKTLCQFYQNPCYFVFEDTTLDVLFKQFKEGRYLTATHSHKYK